MEIKNLNIICKKCNQVILLTYKKHMFIDCPICFEPYYMAYYTDRVGVHDTIKEMVGSIVII